MLWIFQLSYCVMQEQQRDSLYEYIESNKSLLEEWCHKPYKSVIFDTLCGQEIFPKHKLVSTDNVYMIIADTDGNIFGFYMDSNTKHKIVDNIYYSVQGDIYTDIGNTCIIKEGHGDFIFSLQSKTGKKVHFPYIGCLKYDIKETEMYTKPYIDFFNINIMLCNKMVSVSLSMIMDAPSVYMHCIRDCFLEMVEGADRDCFPKLFTLKRFLLIEMGN